MGTNQKNLEAIFTGVFSVMVFALFYFFLGANGLVLGNDPAVHLETAKYFLSTGSMPLSSILWLPPLYHLALATFISFTGAATVDQQLFLIKAVTALMDWLLVFSVYLLAAKFFNKTTGVIAASLLLLCFPLYELNSWGGYTSILSLAFMALLFVYLALPLKSAANAFVAFILAFSVVLSHQLATFISVFILAPFLVVVLVKSRGNYSKALIAAIVGGGIAFGIYYLGPILPYLGELVQIVFFQIQSYAFQIPAVSFNSFMTYFGFIVFFAFAGLVVAYFKLKTKKLLVFYLLLTLAFLVPVLFSQSYLIGFLLPFQWFVYYMLPALVVLAAVTFTFLMDAAFAAYSNNRVGWRRRSLKIFSVVLAAALVAVMVLHFGTVSGKLEEDTTFYSTSDMSAYQAGTWIQQNYPDTSAQVVVSKEPGHWFWVYSGLNVTAETDPIIDWNTNAECVLDLSYELANPVTMARVYTAKTGISDENFVQLNMVWHRVTYTPSQNAYISYRDLNGSMHDYTLDALNRTISMDTAHSPKRISVQYAGDDFLLTQNFLMENNTYPVTVTWELTALNDNVNYVTFYLSQYFDPTMSFTQARIAGALDWVSPMDSPSKVEPNQWAVTDFTRENLQQNSCIDFYDPANQTAYAIRFLDLPDSGNVGALWNRNVDAIRWQYTLFKVEANYTVSLSYQTLAFSQTSYPQLKDPHAMDSLFLQTVEPFVVQCRNFASIIRDNYVAFIVYDKTRFDQKILGSGWVQLVYSNDKYFVLKIKADHPYANVLESVG